MIHGFLQNERTLYIVFYLYFTEHMFTKTRDEDHILYTSPMHGIPCKRQVAGIHIIVREAAHSRSLYMMPNDAGGLFIQRILKVQQTLIFSLLMCLLLIKDTSLPQHHHSIHPCCTPSTPPLADRHSAKCPQGTRLPLTLQPVVSSQVQRHQYGGVGQGVCVGTYTVEGGLQQRGIGQSRMAAQVVEGGKRLAELRELYNQWIQNQLMGRSEQLFIFTSKILDQDRQQHGIRQELLAFVDITEPYGESDWKLTKVILGTGQDLAYNWKMYNHGLVLTGICVNLRIPSTTALVSIIYRSKIIFWTSIGFKPLAQNQHFKFISPEGGTLHLYYCQKQLEYQRQKIYPKRMRIRNPKIFRNLRSCLIGHSQGLFPTQILRTSLTAQSLNLIQLKQSQVMEIGSKQINPDAQEQARGLARRNIYN